MRRLLLTASTVLVGFAGVAGDYPISPLGLTDVRFTEGFWKTRWDINRRSTLPSDMAKCEETPRIANFDNAGKALRGEEHGPFGGLFFDDSDVYKVVEGASYILASEPDPELDAHIDRWISLFAGAQEKDGYIYCARTLKGDCPGAECWSALGESHELYNLGHLFEAAAAHFECTGKRNLLDVAVKAADMLVRTFGTGEGQIVDVPGHEEVELGLCRLYRATNDARYLDLARKFLLWRGDAKVRKRLYGANCQDHAPVLEQREAVGHAVRAAYLYCGMADVAALTGDEAFRKAVEGLWENIVAHKLHLTGGIGARRAGESFGANDRLPNDGAYLETCAAIGNALLNERLFLSSGDAKYVDVLERVIYNGFLSGVSLKGDEFFYPNPLASKGGYRRSKWFSCSCCPVNIVRFIPQLAGFTYAHRGDTLYWNLFAATSGGASLPGGKVSLEQKTDYPWRGEAELTVKPAAPQHFALKVRVPGWAVGRPVPSDLYGYASTNGLDGVSIAVNGEAVPLALDKGYCTVDRTWRLGDKVKVSFPMPVNRVRAARRVQADRGRAAVERGPIVWCAEQADNGKSVHDALLPADAMFSLSDVEVAGHRFPSLVASNGLKLVPYFAWAHRANGEMQTWFPTGEPADGNPFDDNVYGARVSVSSNHLGDEPNDLLDGVWPSRSSDDVVERFCFWAPDRLGKDEWVEAVFPKAETLKGLDVYWFDDDRGCAVPASWSVSAEAEGGGLADVAGKYPVARDAVCEGRFDKPVTSRRFRVCIKARHDKSTGLFEIRPVK